MKEKPEEDAWVTLRRKHISKKSFAKEEAEKQSVKKYTIWQALKDPKVLRLALIYFLWVIGFWGFSFWMPQVLKSLSGWPPSVVAWSIAIPMSLTYWYKCSVATPQRNEMKNVGMWRPHYLLVP